MERPPEFGGVAVTWTLCCWSSADRLFCGGTVGIWDV